MLVAGGDEVVELREGMFTETKCSNVLAGAPGSLLWQELL